MNNKWLKPEAAAELLPLVEERRPNQRLADLVKDMLLTGGEKLGAKGKPLSARAAYRLTGVDNNTVMNMALGVPPPRIDTASRFAKGLGFTDEEVARLIVYAYGVRLYPGSLEDVFEQALDLVEGLDDSGKQSLRKMLEEWKKNR